VGDDFSEDYANNFAFQMSAWDFKILFGELDQTVQKEHINWHTAITMPWGVAKILSQFLYINVRAYEFQNGPIVIPPAVMPPSPGEAPGPNDPPAAHQLYALALRMHQALNGDLQAAEATDRTIADPPPKA
jgi:hypothetical protein